MRKIPLGRSGISVSALCLGSMTWGSQNAAKEGWAQIDQAFAAGVNFIDTAEMYPTTPLSKDTFGRTEEVIGGWVERSGRRGEAVIATKVVGAGFPWGRGPEPTGPVTGDAIRDAVEGSLRRLKTDYIDLYQIHWPNRGSYHFRQAWRYDVSRLKGDRAAIRAEIEEALRAMQDLVQAGKIRAFGLSNETAWGIGQFLEIAEREGLPRAASTQNEYNLLYRSFDLDLAELCWFEDVTLMAYSPLAAGLLSGKYQGGVNPPGSRGTIRQDLGGRRTEFAEQAVGEYVAIARRHGLEPAAMAIAWMLERPSKISAVIGATTPAQLETCLSAADLTLPETAAAEIAQTHRRWPAPI